MFVAYLDQIHFRKLLIVAGLLYVEDRNDVFVVEVAEQFHFPQGTKAKHGMVKRGDFLDGNFLS